MRYPFFNIFALLINNKEQPQKLAQVVGSNPTRSISINQVKYGIKSGLFLAIVGQINSNGTILSRSNRLIRLHIMNFELPVYQFSLYPGVCVLLPICLLS